MISIQLSHFFPSQLLPISTIAASNEEKVIDDYIQNNQQLAYLADKPEIIIASDSSLDSTNDIARHYTQQDSTAASLPTPATGRDQSWRR